jgi:histone deacetylase HOS3
MSRHGRKVPTSFYHRFTVDACALADRYAQGRLVSILEGGYSDRALASGAMAHLCGLVNPGEGKVNEQWWNVENLEKVNPHLMSLVISWLTD